MTAKIIQINTDMNPAFIQVDSGGAGSGFTNQGEQLFSINGPSSILITMTTPMGSTDYLVFLTAGQQAGSGIGDINTANYRIVDALSFWIDLPAPDTCVVSWGTMPVVGTSSGDTPTGPPITLATTVAGIPSASSLARQQLWLASLSQMLFSDGASWYYLSAQIGSYAKLDRYVATLAESFDNVWPLNTLIAGANISQTNLGQNASGILNSGSGILFTGAPLYPATLAASQTIPDFDSLFNSSGLPKAGTFTYTYAFRPQHLIDDPSGYNAVGWTDAFVQTDAAGHLIFDLAGSPLITSAAGAIVVGTRYIVLLTFDGVNFSLYLNGGLVGSAAGTTTFGSFLVNVDDGDFDFDALAYKYSSVSGVTAAALYAVSQVSAF